jgi:hypothetical protein
MKILAYPVQRCWSCGMHGSTREGANDIVSAMRRGNGARRRTLTKRHAHLGLLADLQRSQEPDAERLKWWALSGSNRRVRVIHSRCSASELRALGASPRN